MELNKKITDTELVKIYQTTDELIELQLICEELKNSNIHFIVKGESAGRLYGIIVDGLAEKKIYVNMKDTVKAKEVIEEAIKTYRIKNPHEEKQGA